MDEPDDRLEREHSLCVVLPGGLERNVTVPGSKPLMDLLVNLCASEHLNPSDYTVEVLSANKNIIAYKPNSAVGLLDAEKILLKPKVVEEKITKPYQPQVSVRLLINYGKAHKAVVRVDPKLPLEMLLPIVCNKCEFKVETSVLLRDSQSEEPLDLSKSLNDLGLREVFAKDMDTKDAKDAKDAKDTKDQQVQPAQTPEIRQKKQKENPGFFSLFMRRKKDVEVRQASSAPISPTLSRGTRFSSFGNGIISSLTLPLDTPKKRRAPPPPMAASQSTPSNLSTCHVEDEQKSGESTLKSTKRRAPRPPCAAEPLQELQVDVHFTGTVDSLEDPRESDGSPSVNVAQSSTPSLQPDQTQSSSHCSTQSFLQEATEKPRHSLRVRGRSDPRRTALAEVLMSAASKSTIVERLSHSTTVAKFLNVSPRRSSDGDLGTELKSVLESNLPTENNCENPVERPGFTTFIVVPPKTARLSVSDATPRITEVCLSLEEDNPTTEAVPEAKESKDELKSSEVSGSETPLASSENVQDSPLDIHISESPSASLPSELEEPTEDQEKEEPELSTEDSITEIVKRIERLSISSVESHQDSTPDTDELRCFLDEEVTQEDKEVTQEDEEVTQEDEEVTQEDKEVTQEDEEEANFPPPPPPVFFNEYTDLIIDDSPPSPALSKKSEPPEDESSSPLPKPSTSPLPKPSSSPLPKPSSSPLPKPSSSPLPKPSSSPLPKPSSSPLPKPSSSPLPKPSSSPLPKPSSSPLPKPSSSPLPKPSSSSLSRFAQAVSSAVQKSRLQNLPKASDSQ